MHELKLKQKESLKYILRLMQMDGSLRRTRAEAVLTAWENKMEFLVGFVVGAVTHWAWKKWGHKMQM